MPLNSNIVPPKPQYKNVMRRIKAYWFSVATVLSNIFCILFSFALFFPDKFTLDNAICWLLAISLFLNFSFSTITFIFLTTEKKARFRIVRPNTSRNVIH